MGRKEETKQKTGFWKEGAKRRYVIVYIYIDIYIYFTTVFSGACLKFNYQILDCL